MPAVAVVPSVRRAAVLAFAGVLLTAGVSHANEGGGVSKTGTTTHQSGSDDGNGNLSASVSFNGPDGYHLSYPGGQSDGAGKTLTSSDVHWTPPPCWFGPKYTAKQFKAEYTKNFNDEIPDVHGTFRDAMGMDKAHYEDGYDYPDEKGYKDFNVAQNDKGLWWAVSVNPDADPMAQMSCNDQRPVWVPNGGTPPAGTGHVITPEMLAKLAANHTRVPGVTIETSPTDGQTVNLPTWVWLREDYTPVHVRAYVDLGGGRQIWAETTAEPVSVRIDPGTPDATVFPSSGQCPIGTDGSVGVKYTGNAEAAPPCGVTYRRSTQNRPPFQLNVTATWRVTWVGSDGGGVHPLADGVIDNPRPVTVQEIQSVNR